MEVVLTHIIGYQSTAGRDTLLSLQMSSSAAKKKIVVCGGNGFLGSRICKAAVARNWDVTSIRYLPHNTLQHSQQIVNDA